MNPAEQHQQHNREVPSRSSCQYWQHREQQVQQLKLLLGRSQVPDILVHGPPCTGKTSIVRELVAGQQHAYISCSKALKLRCMLSSAVAQFSQGVKRKRAQAFAAAAGTENSLIWELKAVCAPGQPSRVLVLDDMQQLLAAAEGPLAPLLALREQAGANMSLVLISRAQPAALGLTGLLPGLVAVGLPAYSTEQMVDILAAAGPPPTSTSSSCTAQQQQQLYRRFLSSDLVPEFQRMSRCLPDLASQAAALWPRYLAAALAAQQQAVPDDEDPEVAQQSLTYTSMKPKVQAALATFQPAACCTLASLQAGRGQQQQQQQQRLGMGFGLTGAHMASGLELCRMAKLLLIAAFLASRNKPSVDKQLFDDGAGWRRRGGRRKNAMGADRQAEAAKAAELKGPHTFSLARLMAVYANLLAADENHSSSSSSAAASSGSFGEQQQQQEAAGVAGGGWLGVQSADMLMGVNSLLATRLMTKACDDMLDAPRFSCDAPLELVEQIAMDIGVPLTSYLKYV